MSNFAGNIFGRTWAGGSLPGGGARKGMRPTLNLSHEGQQAQMMGNAQMGFAPALQRLEELGNGPGPGAGNTPRGSYGSPSMMLAPSPRPKKKIMGFSGQAADVPSFGGLDEHYARRQMPGVDPFYRGPTATGAPSAPEIARDMARRGRRSGFGGYAASSPVVDVTSSPVTPPTSEDGWAERMVARGLFTSVAEAKAADAGARGVTVEARAAGGPVNAGQPYLVGEHGPELHVPKESGVIVPNHALPAMPDPMGLAPYITPGGGLDRQARTAVRRELLRAPAERGRMMLGMAMRDAQEQRGMAREDAVYQRRRGDMLADEARGEQRQQGDREALKAERQAQKDMEERAMLAGYQTFINDLKGAGHLTDVDLETMKHAKDGATRIAIAQALTKQGEDRRNQAEQAKKAKAARQPWLVTVPGTETQIYGAGSNVMGSMRPPVPEETLTPESLKAWAAQGYSPDSIKVGGVTLKRDRAPAGKPAQAGNAAPAGNAAQGGGASTPAARKLPRDLFQ